MLKNKIIVLLSLICIVSHSFGWGGRDRRKTTVTSTNVPKAYGEYESEAARKFRLARENFAKEHPKESALFDAIQGNDIKTFNELLPQVDIHAKDWLGRTFLIRATEIGNIEMIQILLKQSHIKIDEQNDYGETALMRAALEPLLSAEDAIKIIKLLLLAGANPNIQNKSGNTFHTYTKQFGIPKKAYYNEYLISKLSQDVGIDPDSASIIAEYADESEATT